LNTVLQGKLKIFRLIQQHEIYCKAKECQIIAPKAASTQMMKRILHNLAVPIFANAQRSRHHGLQDWNFIAKLEFFYYNILILSIKSK
jgi:hypothetical protein